MKEDAMQNRISEITERQDGWDNDPQPIGEVLEELLAQYEAKYPNIHISIVETANAG
jgi:hypothetical protein